LKQKSEAQLVNYSLTAQLVNPYQNEKTAVRNEMKECQFHQSSGQATM